MNFNGSVLKFLSEGITVWLCTCSMTKEGPKLSLSSSLVSSNAFYSKLVKEVFESAIEKKKKKKNLVLLMNFFTQRLIKNTTPYWLAIYMTLESIELFLIRNL